MVLLSVIGIAADFAVAKVVKINPKVEQIQFQSQQGQVLPIRKAIIQSDDLNEPTEQEEDYELKM